MARLVCPRLGAHGEEPNGSAEMRAGGGNVAADMFRWEFGDRALLLECKVDGVTSSPTDYSYMLVLEKSLFVTNNFHVRRK